MHRETENFKDKEDQKGSRMKRGTLDHKKGIIEENK